MPYCAATLLVSKKNVPVSSHVTDVYRLVVDFRFLNNAIKDSRWPTPSLQNALMLPRDQTSSAPSTTVVDIANFHVHPIVNLFLPSHLDTIMGCRPGKSCHKAFSLPLTIFNGPSRRPWLTSLTVSFHRFTMILLSEDAHSIIIFLMYAKF